MPLKSYIKNGVFFMIAANGLEFFGWGFSDCFFSIFTNKILNNFFYVGLVYGTIAFFNLIFTVIASSIIRKTDARKMALWAKGIYVISAIFYFLAGFYKSIIALFVAVVFNGIGRSLRNTSEQDFLIEHSNKKNASKIMGIDYALKNSLWYTSMVFSGFILVWLAKQTNKNPIDIIHYLFLIMLPILAICSVLLLKIKKQNNFLNFSQIKGIVFNKKLFTDFFKITKDLNPALIFSISLIFMLRIMSDMILLFVPLLAISFNLAFWEIGLLIGLLNIPFLFCFISSFIADRIDRLSLIIFGLIFSLFPLFLLAHAKTPLWIGIFASLISLSIAIIQPANLGIIASLTNKKQRANIAGLELFLGQIGVIFGSVVLGFCAQHFGIQKVFLIIGIISFIFASIAIKIKLHIHRKGLSHKHNKKIKEITHHHIIHHLHHHSHA